MPYLKRLKGHFTTITKHKLLVGFLCFKCGLYKQGFLHDFSKYSPVEFLAGVKYYQGYRSPIDAEKEDIGYSLGWLHHKGRNKHHWEYWIDRNYKNGLLDVNEMPLNYLLEAMCDKIAASKIYKKQDYTDSSAYDYLTKGTDQSIMGKENFRRHEYLLRYLKENGEKKALDYYKSLYIKWKNDKKYNI